MVKQQPPTPEVVVSPSPKPTASPTHNQKREMNAPRRTERTAPDAPPLMVRQKRPGQSPPPKPEETNPQIETSPGEIRSPKTGADGASLAAVKKVNVDPFGDEPLAQQFRDLLIASLRANPRLTITEDRNEADAALKGKLTTRRRDQVSLTVRLVNIKGAVLWPAKGPITGRRYQGSAAMVADQIVKDLLVDIQKAERE